MQTHSGEGFLVQDQPIRGAAADKSLLERIARFGGIGFVVLAMLGFFGAGDVGYDDGAKIAAYFADHRARVLFGFHLAGIGMLSFVLWAWWIMKAVEAEGDRRDGLGIAILVSAVMTAAVEYGVIALALTLALISKQPVNSELALALANAYQVFSYVDYFPLSVFFLTFGIAALRTRIVSRWVGWAAIVFVPITLIAAAPSLGLDVGVALPTFIWVVLANIAFIRSRGASSLDRRAAPPAR